MPVSGVAGLGALLVGVVVGVVVVAVGVVVVVVDGVVAPGVVGVVLVGTVAGGTLAAGALVSVVVRGVALEPESPASLTSEAARTPRESTATTSAPTSGARQLGDPARRVRAAAPQCRHHSWCGCRGVPQSGQASRGAAVAGAASG